VLVILVVLYVLMHYLFVSRPPRPWRCSASSRRGHKGGVPSDRWRPPRCSPNYFSALTPQGSSANVIFAGSGYLTQGEMYKLGAVTTAFNLLVFLIVGIPWLLLVAR
jgi:DASS family divalent anion:Na+ symporter